uniref:Uncharacterized protein n=1 Tax=Nelumbo nucifera TaxID=4432 RepID=A0A822Y826_NELNU|nr:TPA_asm: hypothetical protein HUJ06_028927 [Nelumbo nucifera]
MPFFSIALCNLDYTSDEPGMRYLSSPWKVEAMDLRKSFFSIQLSPSQFTSANRSSNDTPSSSAVVCNSSTSRIFNSTKSQSASASLNEFTTPSFSLSVAANLSLTRSALSKSSASQISSNSLSSCLYFTETISTSSDAFLLLLATSFLVAKTEEANFRVCSNFLEI